MIGLCDEMSRTSRTKTMASRDKPSKEYFSIFPMSFHPRMPTFFSSQREEIRTEVEDLVTGMSKGSWKDGKEMER